MASARQRATGAWEFTIKRKGLLAKPIFLTFATREEGEAYCAQLEKLLDRGIIPAEFQTHQPITSSIADAVREYCKAVHITADDAIILGRLAADIGTVELVAVKYSWAETWVAGLRDSGRAPGTIRKMVGALARCLDWVLRREDTLLVSNPLRALPKRYSTTATGRKDAERDRRLKEGEEARILAVLAGGKEEGKQRAVVTEHHAAWTLMFVLAIETAMRMREIYTLTREQIDLERRTVFLDKTKNGSKREVPLSSVAVDALHNHFASAGKAIKLFPFWDGNAEPHKLRATSNRLSNKWANIFVAAKCDDLHFHDLRHEATSRLYERTTLSDIQISRITGHRSLAMLRRYSNLRGSDLADRLW